MADLKTVRKEQGLSQEALADIVGSTHTSISLIETGRVYPTALTRAKIQSILGGQIDWIETRCQSLNLPDKRPEIVGHLMKFLLAPNGQPRKDKAAYIRKILTQFNLTEDET